MIVSITRLECQIPALCRERSTVSSEGSRQITNKIQSATEPQEATLGFSPKIAEEVDGVGQVEDGIAFIS